MARRILVVEDEAPIREMVCFVLEQNGFQPVEAEDYDSAVNQLNEPWPDLILLDWMLPGGSGIQFIKHLKRESMTRDIPVVMLTARGEEEDRVRGLETGADDYITKPFSPKELVARIKAVMRRKSCLVATGRQAQCCAPFRFYVRVTLLPARRGLTVLKNSSIYWQRLPIITNNTMPMPANCAAISLCPSSPRDT